MHHETKNRLQNMIKKLNAKRIKSELKVNELIDFGQNLLALKVWTPSQESKYRKSKIEIKERLFKIIDKEIQEIQEKLSNN